MTVDEIVMFVAARIYEAGRAPWDPEGFERLAPELIAQGDKIARAAIVATLEVIRDADEGMLMAARDWSYAKYGKPVGNDDASGCLQAMIDARLKEFENDG